MNLFSEKPYLFLIFTVVIFQAKEVFSSSVSMHAEGGNRSYRSFSLNASVKTSPKWNILAGGFASKDESVDRSSEVYGGANYEWNEEFSFRAFFLGKFESNEVVGKGLSIGTTWNLDSILKTERVTQIDLGIQRVRYSGAALIQTGWIIAITREILESFFTTLTGGFYHYSSRAFFLARNQGFQKRTVGQPVDWMEGYPENFFSLDLEWNGLKALGVKGGVTSSKQRLLPKRTYLSYMKFSHDFTDRYWVEASVSFSKNPDFESNRAIGVGFGISF